MGLTEKSTLQGCVSMRIEALNSESSGLIAMVCTLHLSKSIGVRSMTGSLTF